MVGEAGAGVALCFVGKRPGRGESEEIFYARDGETLTHLDNLGRA